MSLRAAIQVTPALLIVLLAGCRDTTAPESALSRTVTTEHYVFHFATGDTVNTSWQEQYYAWVISALDVRPTARLDYFKYRNREHLRSITGRSTNGFAEPGTSRFHTIWAIDNHEGVHTLVILYLGHPPALFNEGVAVAHHMDPAASIFTPRWSSQNVHTLARQFDAAGQLPALTSLERSTDFFGHADNLTYPIAGSFVRYLIDTDGLSRFKALLASASFNDAPSQTEARFQAVYGRSLAAAWASWRSWLQSTAPATVTSSVQLQDLPDWRGAQATTRRSDQPERGRRPHQQT